MTKWFKPNKNDWVGSLYTELKLTHKKSKVSDTKIQHRSAVFQICFLFDDIFSYPLCAKNPSGFQNGFIHLFFWMSKYPTVVVFFQPLPFFLFFLESKATSPISFYFVWKHHHLKYRFLRSFTKNSHVYKIYIIY